MGQTKPDALGFFLTRTQLPRHKGLFPGQGEALRSQYDAEGWNIRLDALESFQETAWVCFRDPLGEMHLLVPLLSPWQPFAPSPLRSGLLLPITLFWHDQELCRLEPVNKPKRAHLSHPGSRGEQEVGERGLPKWKNTGSAVGRAALGKDRRVQTSGSN